MDSSDYYDDSEFSDTSSSSDLNGLCPYCSQSLSSRELQYHMDNCRLYREISDRNGSLHSRLFSALRDSLTLYRPWHGEDDDSAIDSFTPSSSSGRLTPEFQDAPYDAIQVSSITCPVCFDYFDSHILKPLILPKCGHTVCYSCLKKIIKTSSIAKCPVCRKNNPTELSRLPVNYALLEFSQPKTDIQPCEKHGHEIVGFCVEDCEILCGACIIEHTDHKIFALTDPEVTEIAEKRKKNLEEEEFQLLSLKTTWQKTMDNIENMSKAIDQLKADHFNSFKKTESKIIEKIKTGKKECQSQLDQISKREEIKEIEVQIESVLKSIQQEIERVKEKNEKFESLSIYEKLSKPKILKSNLKIPDLGPLYKIVLKLQADVNYKVAIKRHQIKILD